MARILIVDDNVGTAEALAHVLKHDYSHQVHHARSAHVALTQYIQQENPEILAYDLVLTDMVMTEPGEAAAGNSGLRVIRAARRKDCLTMILVQTAFGSAFNAMQAVDEGAGGYIDRDRESFEDLTIRCHAAATHTDTVRRAFNALTQEPQIIQNLLEISEIRVGIAKMFLLTVVQLQHDPHTVLNHLRLVNEDIKRTLHVRKVSEDKLKDALKKASVSIEKAVALLDGFAQEAAKVENKLS